MVVMKWAITSGSVVAEDSSTKKNI